MTTPTVNNHSSVTHYSFLNNEKCLPSMRVIGNFDPNTQICFSDKTNQSMTYIVMDKKIDVINKFLSSIDGRDISEVMIQDIRKFAIDIDWPPIAHDEFKKLIHDIIDAFILKF